MTDQDLAGLTAQLRRWAERPASLSPQIARTRVLANLPSRKNRTAWRLAAAGGALAAIGLALALIVGRQSEPIAAPPPSEANAQRMIVHELSSGTKLYIVMQSKAADQTRRSSS